MDQYVGGINLRQQLKSFPIPQENHRLVNPVFA